ncbi:MAG: hypothetical protein ACE5G0_10490 [Rhodothermales bacterium]
MNTDLTEIICIIDRSGSMDSIRSDAIGGFNAFLEGQKEHPGEARLTLVLFDHEYDLVHDGLDLHKVRPLDTSTYVPRGTTALLDAIGRTIDDVGARLSRTPEPQRPGTVIVAILTDGLENASKDYTQQRISEMIEHQRQKYSWEFVFLAANQDAIQSARQLSIQAADAIAFDATGQGVRAAYASLTNTVKKKRRTKKS